MSPDESPNWPQIVIRDPRCHKCPAKTFVYFDGQPYCRECFLAETERREAARSAGGQAHG